MSQQKLFSILANSYGLYLKTQSYHWNVQGSNFYGLHKLFEEQYQELAEAIDEIAEKIRMAGHKVPASFNSFSQALIITDPNDSLSDMEMVRDLKESHNQLCTLISDTALHTNDQILMDFLNSRIEAHRKYIWFLDSIIS